MTPIIGIPLPALYATFFLLKQIVNRWNVLLGCKTFWSTLYIHSCVLSHWLLCMKAYTIQILSRESCESLWSLHTKNVYRKAEKTNEPGQWAIIGPWGDIFSMKSLFCMIYCLLLSFSTPYITNKLFMIWSDPCFCC